jgi:FMN-dependent NADH-azoreductase
MSNILVLQSSVSGQQSVSRVLVAETVARLLDAAPDARVVERDLGSNPVAHLDSSNWIGVRGIPSTDAEFAAREVSDQLIAELRAADTVVIGAPMYNFSISTGLRGWFDYVLRSGETFRYTAAGPEGLVMNKRVIVVESRGGIYSEGPAQALDFQEPYLRQLLAFIGITDVTFIRAEKIGYGPEARDASIASAFAQIGSITRQVEAA